MKNYVTIVCPIYNSTEKQVDFTRKCLSSIEKNSGDVEYEIIIIDDCSKIKVPFEKEFKNTRRIRHRTNKGISSGWNRGIKEAKYEYICIINNDIEVYDGWLEMLIEAFRGKSIGFTFPTPIETDEDKERHYYNTYSDGLCYGPCIMSTKATYECLKEDGHYYDEIFNPCFYEDIDMFHRAKEADVFITMTSKAFVKHLGSQTVNLKPDMQKIKNRNRKRFYKKYNIKKK